MSTIIDRPGLYDLLYSDVIEDIMMYKKLTAGYANVLEYGAGTGRVTIPLSECHSLIALDYERKMLSKLKEKLLVNDHGISIVNGNMIDYVASEKQDAIIVPLTSFNYLTSTEEQMACLNNMSNNLNSDGIAIVELLTPSTFKGINNGHFSFVKSLYDNKSRYDYYRKTNYDDRTKTILQQRIFYQYINNRLVNIDCLRWANHYIDMKQMCEMVDNSNMVVEQVYGDCDLSPYKKESPDAFLKLRKRRYGSS